MIFVIKNFKKLNVIILEISRIFLTSKNMGFVINEDFSYFYMLGKANKLIILIIPQAPMN